MGIHDRDWAREPRREPGWWGGLSKSARVVLVLGAAALIVLLVTQRRTRSPWEGFDPEEVDALYLAILQSDAGEVDDLLRSNPVRVYDRPKFPGDQQSYFHLAVQMGSEAVLKAVLERGADPNRKFAEGKTILHFAASLGRADRLRLLLQHGADVNVRDDLGFTPIFDAAGFTGDGGFETLKVLVDAGADWKMHTPGDVTPLDVAERLNNFRAISYLRQLAASAPASAVP